ncbi:MAG: cysteine synthase family protein [Acidobacteriota bacterium]|nr:cysteine synthase family protein [Acidobacteriota bacterium]
MSIQARSSGLLDAIGKTPLVELSRSTKGEAFRIWAKLEYLNPGGSIKDRIALHMVEKAEREGRLKSGDILLENSSGNTAMGLALVALQKGYRCRIVIRDTTSREKIRMLQHLGVEVVQVDASLSPDDDKSYNQYARVLAAQSPELFYVDQHNNLDNNEAHYLTTGPEIWQQMEGRIDCLVVGIGTGGTICGAGRYLKERDPAIRTVGVDPSGSVFYDYFHSQTMIPPRRYHLEGLGDEFILPTVEWEYIDDILRIDDQTAFEWTLRLARTEGIIAGGSSGAALWGAFEATRRLGPDARIVTVFPDSGYKYCSSIYK